MKKLFNKLLSSGILIQPILMTIIVQYIQAHNPKILQSDDTWLLAFVGSFIPVVMMLMDKIGKPKAENAWIGKQKAMYPEIPKHMLYKEPTGILLGKDKKTGKYVCKPLTEDGHIFLIGGSGSGKSTCHVIPSIIANSNARIFAIDIKGELSYKSTRYGDENVLIFNPSDRSSYGYDPLYRLDEDSDTQAVLEVMQNISYSLISLPADLKDPFWKTSARNLLIGLLIYHYKQGHVDFVAIVDEILGRPVKDSIKKVMDNARPNSVEYRYIVQFDGMEDETLGGIIAEMNNHLIIFANDQDIRYAFKDNGCRINPHKLEEGYSIFLSILEHKLSAYYDVLQLIINQTLAELERRSEDSEPIIMCIDELPRILSVGKLDRLLDGARTLRSRKVCLFLITQSTEALMSAYSENEVADLISNCPYIIVLSASSSKTQRSVCDWCGKYRVKKHSWSGTGKHSKMNTSYDEIDIVEPSDLMTLKNTGEAILITPYGYMRVKKAPYYKDKYFKSKADEIIKHNKDYQKLNKEEE